MRAALLWLPRREVVKVRQRGTQLSCVRFSRMLMPSVFFREGEVFMKRYGSIAVATFAALAALAWGVAAARAGDDPTNTKLIEYYRRKANIPPTAQIEVKDVGPAKIKGAKT